MFFVHGHDTEFGDAQSAHGRGTDRRRWTVGKTVSYIVAQFYAHNGTQDMGTLYLICLEMGDQCR